MAGTPSTGANAPSVQEDVLLIVGGHFTPASLGPQAYEEIRNRARSRSGEYLDAFESLFLGSKFDALLQSRLLLPTLLELLADIEPVRVRTIAEQLLKQYDAVLVLYDEVKNKKALFDLLPEETVRQSQRLDERRIELRALVK